MEPEKSPPDRDGAAVRIPPPLVYLVAIIVGFLLQKFVLPLPLGLPEGLRVAAAVGASLVGIALLGIATVLFKRTGQDPKPWKSTPEIVSTGLYAFSRNPIYIGMALVEAGSGLALSNGWILLLLPPVLVTVYLTAIRHEEAYLERKFGDSYLEYKRSVRRWL